VGVSKRLLMIGQR